MQPSESPIFDSASRSFAAQPASLIEPHGGTLVNLLVPMRSAKTCFEEPASSHPCSFRHAHSAIWN
jgi:hypothetical protein